MLKGFYFLLIWPYFEAFSGLFEDFGKWLEGRMQRWRTEGFTLVEMSMVLVIIGLLVGGVLVGVDLVKAAETRAQITQVEKFNAAATAFKVKYDFLPGDIPDPYASQFGFAARGSNPGQGDGNGILQGVWAAFNTLSTTSIEGEPGLFWEDLSTAKLIGGGFNTATATSVPSTNPADYLPPAAIGHGNYVSVWTGCCSLESAGQFSYNYFSISVVTWLNYGEPSVGYGLTTSQAYAIDSKIDDGLPQSGQVQAVAITTDSACFWSDSVIGNQPCWNTAGYLGPLPGSSNTCMDNRNVAGAPIQYSTEYNSGPLNCSLVIKMQGAAR